MLLNEIDSPADLKAIPAAQLPQLCEEIRGFIVNAVAECGGHLGSNLGAVELAVALHRVFDSPHDAILWDTGHQSYAHKIVTGRRKGFASLRQEGGLSGYPNRTESEHDWIENSHASTVLSYAQGLANAFEQTKDFDRQVVAVLGDGSLTGGMAFEALNNLGHAGTKCVIVLNDNGRSYAPTISRLSSSLTKLRLHPAYVTARQKVKKGLRDLPGVGNIAYAGAKSITLALRDAVEPVTFFEALGVRYTGPIDGHDIERMEEAFRNASAYDGPIVVHVLTQKGRGYTPAENDDEKHLHDAPRFDPTTGPPKWQPAGYTEAFSNAICNLARQDEKVVAITAAMPGPTGLIPFEESFPNRFFDVGIAEQHAVTLATGMAMGGLRPVVAVYSTFFCRAFDQANFDAALHRQPVIFALDRAGITGDDGASHHGIFDLALCLDIPGMVVFCPSSAQELKVMLEHGATLDGPSSIRFPKGAARNVEPSDVGSGLSARKLRSGTKVCILAAGRMVEATLDAADALTADGIDVSCWDIRVAKPLDNKMIADAITHDVVITVEDGIRRGGVGSHVLDAIAEECEVCRMQQPRTIVLGVPTEFIPQAKPEAILSRLGLDAAGIEKTVRRQLG